MPWTALVCKPQMIALLDLVNNPFEVDADLAGVTEVLVFLFSSDELALVKNQSEN